MNMKASSRVLTICVTLIFLCAFASYAGAYNPEKGAHETNGPHGYYACSAFTVDAPPGSFKNKHKLYDGAALTGCSIGTAYSIKWRVVPERPHAAILHHIDAFPSRAPPSS